MSKQIELHTIMDKQTRLNNLQLCIMRKDWHPEFWNEDLVMEVEGTDLFVTPYIPIMDDYIAPLSKKSPAKLEMTVDKIFELARDNAKRDAVVQNSDDMLYEEGEDITYDESESCPMIVLTNQERFFGAASIMSKDALDKARELLKTDVITIIPSSLHEVLAVSITDEDFIKNLIQDVNAGYVMEWEKLSDHPYYYDGEKLYM